MKSKVFFTFLLFFLAQGALAQDYESVHEHEFPGLGSLADIFDNVEPSPFRKLPELRSSNGVLDVDLYIERRWVQIGKDLALLRSYSYRSGSEASKEVGPWGPTLRLGPSDRLNLRIHNNLPLEPDLEYLGSIPIENERWLVEGRVSRGLVEALELAKIYTCGKNRDHLGTINKGSVRLERIEVVKAGQIWRLHGKSTCTCGSEKHRRSGEKHFKYIIERRRDPGVKKVRLRVSEELNHSGHDHNRPHGYNTTNMHTHGWHVSPWQDDVFRQVPAQLFSNYSYDLDGHASGTFWYHPHVHGSTALQVASGMSGALIVEDPDLSAFPHLEAASKPEHERILLINQVNYDPETLEMQSFEQASWQTAPQGTTINGVRQPEMLIQPGEVQRWRFIQSGHDSAVAMHFPDPFEAWQIAVDGIYLRSPRKLRTLHLAPGNRSDVLIKAPRDISHGGYPIHVVGMNPVCEYFPEDKCCIQKPGEDLKEGCGKKPKENEILMYLDVKGRKLDMDLPTCLPKLDATLADVTDDEVVNLHNPRKTEFNIQISPKPLEFQINGKAFDAGVVHERLQLGTAEVWEISSKFSWHPYHIHVNPFQVTQFDGRAVDPPIWKDVIMVTSKTKETLTRSRYTRYWGDFVLHCHILHHEDQGMMQRIRMERPPLE